MTTPTSDALAAALNTVRTAFFEHDGVLSARISEYKANRLKWAPEELAKRIQEFGPLFEEHLRLTLAEREAALVLKTVVDVEFAQGRAERAKKYGEAIANGAVISRALLPEETASKGKELSPAGTMHDMKGVFGTAFEGPKGTAYLMHCDSTRFFHAGWWIQFEGVTTPVRTEKQGVRIIKEKLGERLGGSK